MLRSILPLGLLACFGASASVAAQDPLPVSVDYNSYPRRMRQVEWLRPAFPPAWGNVDETSPITTTLFIKPGPSAYTGWNALHVPAAEIQTYSSAPLDEPHRYAYQPDPSSSGQLSFFLTAHFPSATPSTIVTDIGTIDLSRPIDGPVAASTGHWDSYVPVAPVPNMTTTGDVWVDAVHGDDLNSGYLPSQPVKTLGQGVTQLKLLGTCVGSRCVIDNKTMVIRGGQYRHRDDSKNVLDLTDVVGLAGSPPVTITNYAGESVEIDGYGQGPGGLVHTGLQGVVLQRAENVLIEGLTFYGWEQEGVDPENSKNVTLRFLNIHNCSKWGIQAYGYVEDLTIEGCRIAGIDREHGIYIAGKASAPASPEVPCKRVRISFNTIQHTGRHGIQVNGCQEDILINNNRVLQAKHGGVQVTGTCHARIINNIFGESLKFAVSVFADYDKNVFGQHPSGINITNWKLENFQSIGNIEIAYNTMYVPPTGWTSGEDPAGFDAIRIDEHAQYERHAIGEPQGDMPIEALVEPFWGIDIHDNIVLSQARETVFVVLSTQHVQPVNEHSRAERMLEGLRFYGNITDAAAGPERLRLMATPGPYNLPSTYHDLTALEQSQPSRWFGNDLDTDPSFVQAGPSGHPIVFIAYPELEWWPNHYARLDAKDFGLNAGSPAIDTGFEAMPGVDVAGVTRPLGLGPDRGAHESH